MRNENGISMIALVITIIVIVILASIVTIFSIDSLQNANTMNMREEMRNVEEVVMRQRTRILTGEYTPTMSPLTDAEVDDFFSELSTEKRALYVETIGNIKKVNLQSSDNTYKFYKLTPEIFEEEYADDVTITDIRRDYIVNYGLNSVITINNNEVITNGKVPSVGELQDKGSIMISFNPKGGSENDWRKTAETTIMVWATGNTEVDYDNVKYVWTTNGLIPDDTEDAYAGGESLITNPQKVTYNSNTAYEGNCTLSVFAKDRTGSNIKTAHCTFYIDVAGPDADLTID